MEDVLKPGHVPDEGVISIVGDVKEADAGHVRFDGFVLKLLLSEEANELAEDGLRSREGLVARAGAEVGILAVA